ncbi:ATP-binding cassette domain-containing protein [Pigmentiphaga sp. GD03639]|uniref:ABC transporter ATP-binding protein n=1 Tax=Pigmentiphaga daeguensis TaxID=414049 RepID=A0ABN1B675_9BURK|nr:MULTISPECIES: ATP-binding cassette domain-containing protein [unclassified Pigmentiphaga]MDH2235428.1 ATP-binding cassette domain-containing protein [Pigmentiphaga sp. GD03639]OVZ61495.1 ABC transporter ATP-binding protein [Pigmentiphaga sp. NML030171]
MIELAAVDVVFYPGTPDERIALDRLDLALENGSFCVVVGTNGAGKSTLLNVLAGAVRPRAGRTVIDGTDVSSWPVHRRAQWVSRVFQDPMVGTAPALSIEENLAFAAMRGRRRGLRMALNPRNRAHFRDELARFGLGLENRMGAPAGLLSGGQRQVLALLMAALNRPRILLLDEHTAALDPRTAQLVMQATRRIVAEQRLTTLMITHNMAHALDYGDRLLMMECGRIKLDIGRDEKPRLTINDLVQRFGQADDQILLQASA